MDSWFRMKIIITITIWITFHQLNKCGLNTGTADPICTVPLLLPGQIWGNFCNKWYSVDREKGFDHFIRSVLLTFWGTVVALLFIFWYIHQTKINIFPFCDVESGLFSSCSGPTTIHMIVWDCRSQNIMSHISFTVVFLGSQIAYQQQQITTKEKD